MNKDIARIVKAAQRQGFEVRYTTKGHPMFLRDGRTIATSSGTPSDYRAIPNLISELRHHGFQWPPHR